MEYYTDSIPSHLVEAIERADLSRLESRVLLYLCRHSYGYSTRAAKVVIKDLADRYNQQHRNINMALSHLEAAKVISVIERGQGWRVLAVTEAIEQWQIGGIPADLLNRPRTRRAKGSPDSDRIVVILPDESKGSPRSHNGINLIPQKDHHDPVASVAPVLQESITSITGSSSSSVPEFLQSIGLTEEEAHRFGQPSDPILQGSLAKARTLHEAISARSDIKFPAIYLRTILHSGKLRGQLSQLLDSAPAMADGGAPAWWQTYGNRYAQEASNA